MYKHLALSLLFVSASLSMAPVQAEDDSEVSSKRILVTQSKRKKPDASKGEYVEYSRGAQFKGANVFNFKYKERLKGYRTQMHMGLKKGWITEKEGKDFKDRLDKLERLEKEVSSKNYPKKELDKMEKQFTLYNQDFYKAANKTDSSTPSRKATGKSEKKKAECDKEASGEKRSGKSEKSKDKPSK